MCERKSDRNVLGTSQILSKNFFGIFLYFFYSCLFNPLSHNFLFKVLRPGKKFPQLYRMKYETYPKIVTIGHVVYEIRHAKILA